MTNLERVRTVLFVPYAGTCEYEPAKNVQRLCLVFFCFVGAIFVWREILRRMAVYDNNNIILC